MPSYKAAVAIPTPSNASSSMTATAKEAMRCGQVRPSSRKNKKIMMKYCPPAGDKGGPRLVHAGDKRYKNNYSPAAKRAFHTRHACAKAKKGTPRWLACTKLWGRHNTYDTKR